MYNSYRNHPEDIITGYVYNDISQGTRPIHCINCGNTLLILSGRVYRWAASPGFSLQTIKVNDAYVQHVCHRCKYEHNILIQNVLGGTMPA